MENNQNRNNQHQQGGRFNNNHQVNNAQPQQEAMVQVETAAEKKPLLTKERAQGFCAGAMLTGIAVMVGTGIRAIKDHFAKKKQAQAEAAQETEQKQEEKA